MTGLKQVDTKPRLVFWLPPEEAARRFGVPREELTGRVRAGELQMRAKVAGGELVATLCSTDLLALYGEPQIGVTQPVAGETRARPSSDELNRLHGELVEQRDHVRVLELDRARLEGQLETSGRIERGLQRYADKLEDRLADAEVLRLNLARAVGQLEAEAARLRARLELAEPAGGPARLIEARTTPRPARRRWFQRKGRI